MLVMFVFFKFFYLGQWLVHAVPCCPATVYAVLLWLYLLSAFGKLNTYNRRVTYYLRSLSSMMQLQTSSVRHPHVTILSARRSATPLTIVRNGREKKYVGRLDCDWRRPLPAVRLRRGGFGARGTCVLSARMNDGGASQFIDEWSDNSITLTTVLTGHRHWYDIVCVCVCVSVCLSVWTRFD